MRNSTGLILSLAFAVAIVWLGIYVYNHGPLPR